MLALGMGLQVVLAILFLPLALLVGLETEPQSLSGEIAGVGEVYDQIALFLLIGLIGPIVEELMFRGILIDALAARFQTRGVIFGSSAAFAAFHMVGVSTVQPLESAMVLVPQLFLFGVVLAYLRIRRGRLGPAIFYPRRVQPVKSPGACLLPGVAVTTATVKILAVASAL